GDLEAATSSLERAVDLDPWDPEAHLLRGLAQSASRTDPTEAWRQAVRLDPALADVIGRGLEGGSALWSGPDVFGWPMPSALSPGARVTVYSTSGTAVAQGAWSDVSSRLGTGVWVVDTPTGVRRVAIVSR
ncbi:tetratricopeptide repeat protein, partial [Rubrivirga sp.]|uniref:tetratricopeptide repeat protein n=1 Tax=Rubrivirga sp. TaxID=1885344 RepID=UPI003C794F6E